MPRCIFCNRFSFSLNKGVCKNCYSYYAKKATNFVEIKVNNAFIPVDDTDLPLNERKKALEDLKRLFDNFLKSNEGIFCKMFDSRCIQEIQKGIKDTYEELEDLTIKYQRRDSLVKSLEEKKKSEMENYPKESYSKIEISHLGDQGNSNVYGYSELYTKVEGCPNDYVVFDLETTGFHKENDKIIEIGAIRYIDNTENARFHSYVNPHRSIPRSASAVNHITQSKVKNAPDIEQVLMDFYVFIGDLPLIAYNSNFDMNFIQYNTKNVFGKALKNDVIDALPLARKYLPELPNKKLETVKYFFKLDVGSHNAIDDCIVTNHLYQYCKQYEAVRFKYAMPFTYQAQELNDIEVEYLNTVVEILEKNDIKKAEMGMDYDSKFLKIYDKREGRFAFDIRIKMYGKLKYVLLDVPLSRFENECNTDIKHTEGSSDERGKTRLFTENPQQLWDFEKYLVNKQRH